MHSVGPRIAGCWVLLMMVAGCGAAGGPEGEAIDTGEVQETSSLALSFAEAEQRYQVPADLLKSVAYNATGLEAASGEIEFDGQAEPWGLFGLAGEELSRAAALAGVSVDEVRTDDRAAIMAAAALLRAYADEAGLGVEAREDLGQWGAAVRRLFGLDEEMQAVWLGDVLRPLASGLAVPMLDGSTLVIGKRMASKPEDPGYATLGSGLGQSGALWRPSPNYNSRSGSAVDLVVIHTCEGPYSGCVSWLRNTAAQASAHYVVKEDGREISQLVDENNRAWHVAARYRSSLNGGVMAGRDGQSTNTFSVGIEHGGRAAQRSWPQGQIDASVGLVRGITSRHTIPRDRYHIVGHGRLQPENRTDPGPNWPWTSYIQAIAAGSGGGNPPPSGGEVITVDNTTAGRFQASSAWDTSTWAAGKVGANYRFHAAVQHSDPAQYKVALASAGRYQVFARVPGNGYNTDTPYIIHHRGGDTVVRKNVNTLGASWISLGTFDFAAGDDWRVTISCWTSGSGWVVADAVRFERR